MEKMPLFTKSIFKLVEKNDGTRISVMSRHTKNDGKTPDERIIKGETYHEWLKEFGSRLELLHMIYYFYVY